MTRNGRLAGVAGKETAPVPRTALRWEAHKEETRRKLLDSARRLFAERGFQATSAADIAAGAGVTERTLFRYFPSKSALVLDEAISLLPAMFEAIRNRPAGEPPYDAVRDGILEFFKDRSVLLIQVVGAPGAVELPMDDRQRTLLDFEEPLAEMLRDRYALPAGDEITASVWARASIGAMRAALNAVSRRRTPDGLPKGAFADAIRAAFAALPGTPPAALTPPPAPPAPTPPATPPAPGR